MRSSFVHFVLMYPQRKYRHAKPDVKLLLERKEDDYVDVALAACPRATDHRSNMNIIKLFCLWSVGSNFSLDNQ